MFKSCFVIFTNELDGSKCGIANNEKKTKDKRKMDNLSTHNQ